MLLRRLEITSTTTVTTYGSILYSSFTAIWLPVGMYRYRMYRPPNRMEARTLTLGRQMVKITRAMASQPRSPKALLDHTPLA